MDDGAGKNWGNLSLSDGGKTLRGERPASGEVELERAARALFYAMRGKDGKAVSKNFRNAARGHTSPLKQIIRRFKEAKAKRNDATNYPLMKRTVRELDRWVDELHGKGPRQQITGEFPPAA